MTYVLAYDIGTTGVKTCIFEIEKTVKLLCGASRSYPLYILPDGGAEQDGDDWWNAMCESTAEALEKSGISVDKIAGISFCSQMQGLVLVDKDGIPVHRPMSYMDQRSTAQLKKWMANGLQVAGANVVKLIPSLVITGAVSSSVKDPVYKFKWIEENEPENFSRAYKWLDVKDYLTARCTGRFTMTQDSAFGTLIYDTRKGKEGWSKTMCRMFGIKPDILPDIIASTDMVGSLSAKAAAELGLKEGTPVFGGGGDASLIGVGAGATKLGDTHIYSGTSGWVITVVDKQMVDVNAMIAAITGAQTGKFNYFAEMETAGKSLEWVKDHLALDEIGIYLEKKHVTEGYESTYTSLYDYMTDVIKDVPPGANGVIFTPWLHGNRCPFEDPDSTGMFFGIKLETGKTDMIRAVLEGVFYHLRWMLECQDSKIKTSNPIRFVGGGALSKVSCQMLADITGRRIETVTSPQNVGSVGAAVCAAVGLGVIDSIENAGDFIPADAVYEPDMEKHARYEPYYNTFKQIYKTNKKLYKEVKGVHHDRKELWRTIKFALISVSAGAIQALALLLFNLVLKKPLNIFGIELDVNQQSYFIALILSVIWNFTFNRRYTFKSASNVPKAMALVFLFYLFFTPFSTWLVGVMGKAGCSALVSDGANMVLNLILEYLYQRFVVFKNTIDTNDLAQKEQVKS